MIGMDYCSEYTNKPIVYLFYSQLMLGRMTKVAIREKEIVVLKLSDIRTD